MWDDASAGWLSTDSSASSSGTRRSSERHTPEGEGQYLRLVVGGNRRRSLRKEPHNKLLQLTGTIAACASALAQVPAAEQHVMHPE